MPFRLLDLPLEIQRMIFAQMFSVPSKSKGCRGVSMVYDPSRAKTSVLRVLTLCWWIYQECLPLFYSQNTLRFGTPTQLWYFLRSLSSDRKAWVRELVIGSFGPTWRGSAVAPKAFGMLQLLPRLKYLELDLEVMDPEMGAYYEWTELLDVLCRDGLSPVTKDNVFEPGKWRLIDFDSFSAAVVALASLRGVRLRRVWGMPDSELDYYAEELPEQLALNCCAMEGAWVKDLRAIMGQSKSTIIPQTLPGAPRKGRDGIVMGSGDARLKDLLRTAPILWEKEGIACVYPARGREGIPIWGCWGYEIEHTLGDRLQAISGDSEEIRDQDGVNVDRRTVQERAPNANRPKVSDSWGYPEEYDGTSVDKASITNPEGEFWLDMETPPDSHPQIDKYRRQLKRIKLSFDRCPSMMMVMDL